jgi:CheY-like chemotaxis protein
MAENLSAIADLIWPLLALALLTYLYIRRKDVGARVGELMRTRNVKAQLGGFGFEVGGQPVTAQQVVDDQRRQTEQLRQELSLISAQVAVLREAVPEPADTDVEPRPSTAQPFTRRVLWVDDQPSNNAYEIAALDDRDVHVDVATSTAEALRRLSNDPNFDAIVTDMHRNEEGESRDTAGLTLLRELRQRRIDIPVVVYASPAAVDRYREAALELGSVGVTANSSALLELLAVNYGPRFSTRLKRQVRVELERSESQPVLEPPDSPIDFRAQREGRTLGIDVKSWGRHVGAGQLRAKLAAIERAGYDFPVWIVTAEGVELPPDVPLPEGVELLSVDELRERLKTAAS